MRFFVDDTGTLASHDDDSVATNPVEDLLRGQGNSTSFRGNRGLNANSGHVSLLSSTTGDSTDASGDEDEHQRSTLPLRGNSMRSTLEALEEELPKRTQHRDQAKDGYVVSGEDSCSFQGDYGEDPEDEDDDKEEEVEYIDEELIVEEYYDETENDTASYEEEVLMTDGENSYFEEEIIYEDQSIEDEYDEDADQGQDPNDHYYELGKLIRGTNRGDEDLSHENEEGWDDDPSSSSFIEEEDEMSLEMIAANENGQLPTIMEASISTELGLMQDTPERNLSMSSDDPSMILPMDHGASKSTTIGNSQQPALQSLPRQVSHPHDSASQSNASLPPRRMPWINRTSTSHPDAAKAHPPSNESEQQSQVQREKLMGDEKSPVSSVADSQSSSFTSKIPKTAAVATAYEHTRARLKPVARRNENDEPPVGEMLAQSPTPDSGSCGNALANAPAPSKASLEYAKPESTRLSTTFATWKAKQLMSTAAQSATPNTTGSTDKTESKTTSAIDEKESEITQPPVTKPDETKPDQSNSTSVQDQPAASAVPVAKPYSMFSGFGRWGGTQHRSSAKLKATAPVQDSCASTDAAVASDIIDPSSESSALRSPENPLPNFDSAETANKPLQAERIDQTKSSLRASEHGDDSIGIKNAGFERWGLTQKAASKRRVKPTADAKSITPGDRDKALPVRIVSPERGVEAQQARPASSSTNEIEPDLAENQDKPAPTIQLADPSGNRPSAKSLISIFESKRPCDQPVKPSNAFAKKRSCLSSIETESSAIDDASLPRVSQGAASRFSEPSNDSLHEAISCSSFHNEDQEVYMQDQTPSEPAHDEHSTAVKAVSMYAASMDDPGHDTRDACNHLDESSSHKNENQNSQKSEYDRDDSLPDDSEAYQNKLEETHRMDGAAMGLNEEFSISARRLGDNEDAIGYEEDSEPISAHRLGDNEDSIGYEEDLEPIAVVASNDQIVADESQHGFTVRATEEAQSNVYVADISPDSATAAEDIKGSYHRDLESGQEADAGNCASPEKAPVKKLDDKKIGLKWVRLVSCMLCLTVLVVVAVIVPLLLIGSDSSNSAAQGQGLPNAPWTLVGNPLLGAENSSFGVSSAIGDGFFAIGAPGMANGTVISYFLTESNEWEKLPDLSSLAEGSRFGQSIDATGNLLVIGAPFAPAPGTPTRTGSAYLYELESPTRSWTAIATVIRGEDDVFDANEEFGASVAVASNKRFVVGAPKSNVNSMEMAGRVYIYGPSGETARRLALEVDPFVGENQFDLFGASVDVSMDGSRIIAGAPGAKPDLSTGYVAVYGLENSTWALLHDLPGSSLGEEFGSSVSMISASGSLFAVGAPAYSNYAGRIVVYDIENGSPTVVGPEEGIVGDTNERIGENGMMYGTSESGEIALTFATRSGTVKSYRLNRDSLVWELAAEPLKLSSSSASSLAMSDDMTTFVAGSSESVEGALYSSRKGQSFSSHDPSYPTLVPAPETTSSPTGATQSSTMRPTSPIAVTPAPSPAQQLPVWQLNTESPFVTDAEGLNEFGFSVAITEFKMAAGAPDILGNGAVFTYIKPESGIWTLDRQVPGDAAGGRFGTAVDLTSDGSGMLVGAPFVEGSGSRTEAGAAYYFEYVGGAWRTIGSTIFSDAGSFASNEHFGSAVALSDNGVLIIGAPQSSYDNVAERGRVSIFRFGADWTATATFEGESANEALGTSVDISADGQVVIIGSPGGESTGFASVYMPDGSRNWTLVDTMFGEAEGEAFGTSVKLLSPDGGLIAVGAPGYIQGTGRVVIFQRMASSLKYEQLGPAIIGQPIDKLGSRNTIGGASNFPSIMLGTFNGQIRRFDYDAALDEWNEATVPAEIERPAVAIAAGPGHSTFVVGEGGVVSVYDLIT